MKKKNKGICFIIAVIVSVIPLFPVYAGEKEVPEELSALYARSAVLMDADSGRVLFGKDEKTQRAMASTTKIMTCILTLENMEEDQVATASAKAAGQPKVRLGVQEDEEFYLKDLLYSLMLESHNDSAVVIAETIAGSVEKFADKMNKKAEELGLSHTHFVSPNGLDSRDEGGVHSTTAEELARIMKYCIKDSPMKEEFLKITQTPSYSFKDVKGEREFGCNNHNAFLSMMEGAISGKTGFTGDAGYCYVGALENDGRTYIVALLACGWPNNKSYKWSDTKKLMEYGILHFKYKDVHKEIDPGTIKVGGGLPDKGKLSGTSTVNTTMDEEELNVLLGEDEEVTVDIQMKEELEAPVKKGTPAGTVKYMLNGEVIKTYLVTADENTAVRDFSWCLKKIMHIYAIQEGLG